MEHKCGLEHRRGIAASVKSRGEAAKRFLSSLYQTPSRLIALQFAAHGCDSKVSLLAGQGVSCGSPEGSASILVSVFVDFAFCFLFVVSFLPLVCF